MNSLEGRLQAWNRFQEAKDYEADRLATLRQPLPQNLNDASLYRPMKVKVLKGFFVNGVEKEPGETVSIPFVVARDMIASRRAEPVS